MNFSFLDSLHRLPYQNENPLHEGALFDDGDLFDDFDDFELLEEDLLLLEEETQKTLAQMPMSSWFGTKDPFIGKDKREERIALYNNKFDLHPEVNTYDGGHTLCSDILANEINRLENITLRR